VTDCWHWNDEIWYSSLTSLSGRRSMSSC